MALPIETIRSLRTLPASLFAVQTSEDLLRLASTVQNAEWHPVGGRRNNYATIHVGADPGDALIERVTNGIDALVEREMLRQGVTGLASPREAAQTLFGIPNGRLAKVPTDRRRQLAEALQVCLRDSGDPKRPTAVVEDRGIGQHPTEFPVTLLSLNEENKVQRPELMGAYGQGGSAVFAFADLALFVSRRDPAFLKAGQRDEVGWTIVRFNPLDDDHKTGVYEYLMVNDGTGRLVVPTFTPSELPDSHRDFVGCYFVAVGYDLERFSDSTFQPKRSLWQLLNTVLFDPTYPVLIVDERTKAVKQSPKSAAGIVAIGNATRLTEDKRDNVEYDDEYAIQLSDANGTAMVRYWLLTDTGDPKRDWERMANYVPHEQAVTITLNGQRQGMMRREIFNKLGLLSLGKALLVQVDCDNVSKHAKKQLFSATRDRMKDSSITRELETGIARALGSDGQLRALEKERKAKVLARQAAGEASRINRLLRDAIGSMKRGMQQIFKKVVSTNTQYQLLGDQPLLDEDSGESQKEQTSPAPDVELTPAPAYPTDMRVLNPVVRVPAGGTGVVRLMLDAPDDYVSPDPASSTGTFSGKFSRGANLFHLTGFSALRRGVVRVTIGAEPGIPPGERGRVIFAVTRPGDLPLLAEADVLSVEPPRPRAKPAGEKPGQEQAPNVIAVDREMWLGTLGQNDETIARVEEDGEETKIYVYKEYPPLMARLRRERVADEHLVDYQSKFVAAMALDAWLQYSSESDSSEAIEQDALDAEMRRTAEVYMFAQSVAKEKAVYD